MRAIIIDDKDAKALLKLLELSEFQQIKERHQDWPLIQEVHRKFHYVVCCWLQEQGADPVR